MASRVTRINRVVRVLEDRGWPVSDEAKREGAAEIVDAIGWPDPMGAKEVQEALGVTDLRKATGVPEHKVEISTGRLWDGDEVRAAARDRKRRRVAEVSKGGKAPHKRKRASDA